MQQSSGLQLEDQEDTQTSIMHIAKQLVELMFSWIEQRELCAEQLKKLADELDSLRERTHGSAAPLGVGVTAGPRSDGDGSMRSGVTERFLSSDTMKKAQEAEKESKETETCIHELLVQLKVKLKKTCSITDPDEVQRHIVEEILTDVVRRQEGELRWNYFKTFIGKELLARLVERAVHMCPEQMLEPEVIDGAAEILTFFTSQIRGKETKPLFAEGAEKLSTHKSTAAFKGGAVVVGGAAGRQFELPAATDNWTELIEKNHVTEASQSLRDTADEILQICRTLRRQFDDVKRMYEETTKRQREDEEGFCREKNTQQDCAEVPESPNKDNVMRSKFCAETHTDQSHVSKHCGALDSKDQESDSEDQESDSKDQESDSEDQESDSEDQESDSEEEAGDHKREQMGGKVKRKTKRQRETNLTSVSAALLNVRSMNNKTFAIKNIITQNKLDVFLTTETWLKRENADEVLRQASPPNFSFYYQVRDGRGGGGVAIQFSDKLQGEQIHFDNITKFEYVAATLGCDNRDRPVPIINVYYPPGYNKEQFRAFLREFQGLLDEVFNTFSSIIVTGDFNIWVDREKRTFTDEFDFLLLHNGLVQHVRKPTHRRGHTLDLVITRNVDISDLFVRDDRISDHFTVYFNMRQTHRKNEKPKENMDRDEQAEQFKRLRIRTMKQNED